MVLLIDVGNTNMVFGIYEAGKLVSSFRLTTSSSRTSDELGVFVSEYMHRFNHRIEDVKEVVVASVVPQVMYTLTSAVVKYFNRMPLIVDVDIDTGLEYDFEERLGTDRAVNLVGAIEKYGAPLIVVDFGTATTVDAVSAEGRYLGGTISAGIKISMDALFSRTAALPRIELAKPDFVTGTTTVEQMQAGAVFGYVGSMEYIIRKMKEEMGGGDIKVIATGGLARLISENTDEIDIIDPTLTLDGMSILYERDIAEKKINIPNGNNSKK